MWGDMASVDSKLIKYPESFDSHLSRDMPPEEKGTGDRQMEGGTILSRHPALLSLKL